MAVAQVATRAASAGMVLAAALAERVVGVLVWNR
jgi:hypothetical protein